MLQKEVVLSLWNLSFLSWCYVTSKGVAGTHSITTFNLGVTIILISVVAQPIYIDTKYVSVPFNLVLTSTLPIAE